MGADSEGRGTSHRNKTFLEYMPDFNADYFGIK